MEKAKQVKNTAQMLVESLLAEGVNVLADGWTVKTASGSLSAHFEHTIAITSDGPVILTRA